MSSIGDDAWLAAARACSGEPDDLVAVRVPTVGVQTASLARRGAGAIFDGAEGPGGGAVVAGFGETARLVGRGDARWEDIDPAAVRIFASIRGPAAADVRLLGGVAFLPERGGSGGDGLGDAVFVLPRWTWTRDAQGERLVLVARRRDLDGDAVLTERDALFAERVDGGAPASSRAGASARAIDDGAAAFVSRVEAACAAIASGALEKVVVGRRVELELGGPADVDATWTALRAREAGTMRLLWRDGGSTLLAASPERLVVREGARVVCDALAGTIPRTRDDASAIAELMASDKDRREHDVVVRTIAEAVRDAGGVVRFADAPSPRTLRALHHLATEIEGTFETTPPILDLARRLHPTPAVAGTPREAATAFLREHEAGRGWFTGCFGWIDGAGNGAFAVILRAVLLRGTRAHLFAGTGIVRGSEPARELAETEAKLRAARGALGLETALGLHHAPERDGAT